MTGLGAHAGHLLLVYLQLRGGIAGSYILLGSYILSFLRSLHIGFHSDCTNLTFPPTVYKGSLFSTPSPAFTVCRLLDDGHSDKCEMVSHCSFDLHFSRVMLSIFSCVC